MAYQGAHCLRIIVIIFITVLLSFPVIAGERDRIVPAPHSRRLLEAWTGAKRWVLLPGADHNGIHLHPGYRPAIHEFLGSLGAATSLAPGRSRP